VSKVKELNNLFSYASNFNQPVDRWDVSSATSIQYMFAYTGFEYNLDCWSLNPAIFEDYHNFRDVLVNTPAWSNEHYFIPESVTLTEVDITRLMGNYEKIALAHHSNEAGTSCCTRGYLKYQGECMTCPPNHFGNSPDASECTPCPANTFSTAGSVACDTCAVGYHYEP